MPIYGYQCTVCSFQFELKQSFNDKPKAICPKCGGEARRKFYPPPIFFKGVGFSTTYRG